MKYELWKELTNLETNNSYNPSKCMSFTGTWLPIRSASNLLVKTVPIFWMPIYAFREGSCTGTNAGHKLHCHSVQGIKIQSKMLKILHNTLTYDTNIDDVH